MIRRLSSFHTDQNGASAAEFALVLPLILLFLLGIIDVGRYAWTFNKMEKAVQIGARAAVVTDFVAPRIASANYVDLGVPQGDVIPASKFGVMVCSNTTCTCQSGSCPLGTAGAAYNSAAFSLIANRMRDIEPDIADGNVFIEYRGSGLGYAGDPNVGSDIVSDIAPLTTVRLSNMQFQPITTLLFATTIPLPSVSHTLTMEDGLGSAFN